MHADDPLAAEYPVDGGGEARQIGALGELVAKRPQESAAIEVGGRLLQLGKGRVKVGVAHLAGLARARRPPARRASRG